ncbi:putative plexin domain-containing protein 2 [Penaeus vannamei]|uniref:Putative plexin domain-containing protein 2 n=1 Tax=Penaeus vannamei TaxID=6689 RepID=A0A423SZ22_PENVA|nr:putative plexin domain-containing protein 2 [Penaeus vannamei]
MTTNETWKSFEPDSYYRSFLDKKKRPDGRGLTDSRSIMIRVGTVTTAEGSSTVRMGHTTVMCGIKAEIATPALRQPDQGLIVPNVELYACCSPMFKAGPPGEKAISTSQFLKNVIISSGMLDLTELCIVNNKYVWCLFCDIVCLNYDGNLTDAALVALVAALQNLRLPATSFDPDDQKLQVQSLRTVKVNVKAFPVASTFTIYSEDIQQPPKNMSEDKTNEKSDGPKDSDGVASLDKATAEETTFSENDPDSGDNRVSPVDGFNTKNTTVDHHRYYQSFTYAGVESAGHYWVDLNASENVVINEMLSTSHRRAATVTLTFDFPFYGHLLRNITIATGGFLFTGDFVHTWLAATQYIAPLMANFDTSLSKNAYVKYADNGTSFTVQWNNVLLKDHKDAGTFTFQVTLHETGDIVFIYKEIPLIVTSIGDDQHPVKVGLSDAYIVDRTIFFQSTRHLFTHSSLVFRPNLSIPTCPSNTHVKTPPHNTNPPNTTNTNHTNHTIPTNTTTHSLRSLDLSLSPMNPHMTYQHLRSSHTLSYSTHPLFVSTHTPRNTHLSPHTPISLTMLPATHFLFSPLPLSFDAFYFYAYSPHTFLSPTTTIQAQLNPDSNQSAPLVFSSLPSFRFVNALFLSLLFERCSSLIPPLFSLFLFLSSCSSVFLSCSLSPFADIFSLHCVSLLSWGHLPPLFIIVYLSLSSPSLPRLAISCSLSISSSLSISALSLFSQSPCCSFSLVLAPSLVHPALISSSAFLSLSSLSITSFLISVRLSLSLLCAFLSFVRLSRFLSLVALFLSLSLICQWCNRIGRCSNGLDRHRQDWLHNSCETTSIQNSWECANLPPVPSSTDNPYQTASPTSVDTFGHNARVEPANRGSDSSSATNNNNGSNSPSQQKPLPNLPIPTLPRSPPLPTIPPHTLIPPYVRPLLLFFVLSWSLQFI